jgi:hypothetical protein
MLLAVNCGRLRHGGFNPQLLVFCPELFHLAL